MLVVEPERTSTQTKCRPPTHFPLAAMTHWCRILLMKEIIYSNQHHYCISEELWNAHRREWRWWEMAVPAHWLPLQWAMQRWGTVRWTASRRLWAPPLLGRRGSARTADSTQYSNIWLNNTPLMVPNTMSSLQLSQFYLINTCSDDRQWQFSQHSTQIIRRCVICPTCNLPIDDLLLRRKNVQHTYQRTEWLENKLKKIGDRYEYKVESHLIDKDEVEHTGSVLNVPLRKTHSMVNEWKNDSKEQWSDHFDCDGAVVALQILILFISTIALKYIMIQSESSLHF